MALFLFITILSPKALAQSLDESFNIVIVEPFGYGLSDGASTNRTILSPKGQKGEFLCHLLSL